MRAELIRIIRKIALVEERLSAIDWEITQSKATDPWRLKEKVEDVEKVRKGYAHGNGNLN